MAGAIKIFILLISVIAIIEAIPLESDPIERENIIRQCCECCRIECAEFGVGGYSCANNDCTCPDPEFIRGPHWSPCFIGLLRYDETHYRRDYGG